MWELKGITSGRESNNLHCACGMERKHFREGKVRISMWIKRKYFWVKKESLEGGKGKNMHVGIEKNYFREGK